ncbi:phage terminase large subunit family protein [Lamprobacter modestohalophilus]|uniref:phage terminase large subunit family protein n=1 Tax=Lamprobacter modestohalophilus TaxID=1064514 RepID=UPI002ADECEC9|nr:phage terminase large subunit family protein [Lamprobacter modestohalophilus]MEA1052349.1 phage terminase large subunit family protein [Lamprobacter modestohalophilus]
MQTADVVISRAWETGLAPDPALSLAAWADAHRVLTSVTSAEPGRWRTARTPYLAAVMDALSPAQRAERVVLMAGAQIGKTETGLNWVGYVIHRAPGPMLLVQPTVETAKRVSKQRLDALIESVPALGERVKDPRSRDSGNTQLMKEFPGGVLILTGANSAVGLRSMPVRYLFLDEVDGYPGDAANEGDPVALAIQRTATFSNRKIYLCSTPTIKGFSRIEAAYLESDQRRFLLPCDHCGEFSARRWQDARLSPLEPVLTLADLGGDRPRAARGQGGPGPAQGLGQHQAGRDLGGARWGVARC